MTDKTTNLDRRGFLVSVGLGSAGVAAGAIGAKALVERAIPAERKPGPGNGYRLSEHVQNYYKTARV